MGAFLLWVGIVFDTYACGGASIEIWVRTPSVLGIVFDTHEEYGQKPTTQIALRGRLDLAIRLLFYIYITLIHIYIDIANIFSVALRAFYGMFCAIFAILDIVC